MDFLQWTVKLLSERQRNSLLFSSGYVDSSRYVDNSVCVDSSGYVDNSGYVDYGRYVMLDMWTTVYMWTTPNVCVTFSLSLIVRWQGTTLGTTYLVWWQVTCSSNNSFHLASTSFEEESKMKIYVS